MKRIKTEIVTYVTTDYGDFKKLLGNREVTEERVSAIVKSIEKVGQMLSPILINEKNEVIDGQGRLKAFERLNLPVYYQIEKNAGIEECIAMNIKMKNWKTEDFIKSYADRGYKDYQLLLDLKEQYPYHSLNTIALIMAGTLDHSGPEKKIKNGNYKILNETKGKECLAFIDEIQPKIEHMACRTSTVYSVLTGLFFHNLIDINRMTSQFNAYSSCASSYIGDVDSCLDVLQDIYNYRKRSQIRFKDRYLTIMDDRRSENLISRR